MLDDRIEIQGFLNKVMTFRAITERICKDPTMFPPPEAKELAEIRRCITEDYDVRRAARSVSKTMQGKTQVRLEE